MFNLYRQIFALGILSLLHAAYSAAQHRSYLRITEQEFDGLPFDIFVQGVVSLFMSMYGILYLAGDFKEVRAIEELECKTWETLHNTPAFYIFNHREPGMVSFLFWYLFIMLCTEFYSTILYSLILNVFSASSLDYNILKLDCE